VQQRGPLNLLEYSLYMPAAVTAVALAGLWGWGRWWYLEPDQRAEVLPAMTAGWLLAMWVAASYATIGAVASIHGRRGLGKLRRTTVSTVAIGAGCALLLILVVVNARTLSMGDAMQVYVLLLAWLIFLAAVTRAARVLSPAMMVMVPGVVTGVLLGLSVVAVPVVRAVGPNWVSTVTTLIAYLSPMQALFAATQPSLKVGLPTMPLMYQLSPLGQDIPMGAPVWWVSAMVFGGIAAGIFLVDWKWSWRGGVVQAGA
jgi:hypothetical protein